MKNRKAVNVSSLASALAMAVAIRGVMADSSYSYSGGAYTQNFNSLWTNGTTPPQNYEPNNPAVQLNSANGVPIDLTGSSQDAFTTIPQISTMDGWWAVNQGGQNKALNYTIDDGSIGDQALTAFYDPAKNPAGSTSNNLALGAVASATTGYVTFGVKLVNTSNTTYNAISLAYTGELFHQDGGQKSLAFGYLVDSSNSTPIPQSNTTQYAALNVGGFVPSAVAGAANQTQSLSVSNLPLSSSWAPGQALWLTWQMDQGGGGQGLGIDDLSFSAANIAASPTLTWAVGNGTWDTTSANWAGSSNKFTSGSNDALFNTIATDTTITVQAGGINAAGNITINNSGAGKYTFTGGSIGGSAVSLNINGGRVQLTSPNSYGQGTNVNAGTLVIDADAELGANTALLKLNGGTLQLAGNYSSTKRALTVASGGTFNTNGFNASFAGNSSGPVTINGTLTKTGLGDLSLGTQPKFGASGSLDIETGTVTIVGTSTSDPRSAATDMFNGGVINGKLILQNGVRLNFDSGTFSGTGEIDVQSGSKWFNVGNITNPKGQLSNGTAGGPAGAVITNASGTRGGNIAVNIHLNTLEGTDGAHPAFTRTDVSNPHAFDGTVVPSGNFVSVIGGTKNGNAGIGPNFANLTISGVISGDSDINVGNDFKSGGSGNLILMNHNTYNGVTMLNGGGAALPVLYIGVDNALPTNTDVVFSSISGAGTPSLDLLGHNQTIQSLSIANGTNSPQLSAISNTGSTPATLTISGSVTPYYGYNGQINDGGPTLTDANGNIIQTTTQSSTALVKDGSSTFVLGQYLDSLHTTLSDYSGGTTIKGGIIQIPFDGALGAPTGSLTFDGGSLVVKAPDLLFNGNATHETSITLTSSRPLAVTANGGSINSPTFTALDSGNGTHSLVEPVVFTGNGGYNWGGTLQYSGDAGNSLTINGGTGNVTVSGLPAVRANTGANVFVGGAADPFTDSSDNTKHVAIVSNGLVDFTAGAKAVAGISGTGTVQVDYGATLTSDGAKVATLVINGTHIIRANATSAGTSVVSTLTLAGSTGNWIGHLDLSGNKLVVEAAVSKPSVIATLQNQIASATSTTGITSTGIPANMGIAVMDNAVLGKSTFGGAIVDSSSVLVSQELLGDANADGIIDNADLQTVLNNFGNVTTAWTSGNFDGARTVDLTDLAYVLNNFGLTNPNASGIASGGTQTSAAPEPASLAVLGLGAVALLRRRKHS